MQELNIIELIESNPIAKLSQVYNGKLLNKIQENFTGFEQQLFVSSFFCYLNYDKTMDFIIDLCPDREEAINHPNKLLVYKNRNNYKINNKILFTQAYKKDIEDVFKREEFLFINPFFAQYLKTILLKTIFSKGTLSLELFIILIYSIYFENTYISNINPEYNWKDSKEQHCIEQRMLFQYLIKRNKIKII